jgi:hypothetical protein
MELLAWMQNHGVELVPGEISIINKMDSIYLEHANKQMEKK